MTAATSSDRRAATRRARVRLGAAPLAASMILLPVVVVVTTALLTDPSGLATDTGSRPLPPSLAHPFGTDHLGRDLFTRVMRGLALSLGIGVVTALLSTAISAALGIAAALALRADVPPCDPA